jgi:hypothetical protein
VGDKRSSLFKPNHQRRMRKSFLNGTSMKHFIRLELKKTCFEGFSLKKKENMIFLFLSEMAKK